MSVSPTHPDERQPVLRWIAVASLVSVAACVALFAADLAFDPADGNGSEALDSAVGITFVAAVALGWIGLVIAAVRRRLLLAGACSLPAALGAYVVWVIFTREWQ
jgi:hypothetical protein